MVDCMGLFENMLQGNETIFADTIALDFDYQPKIVLHREAQQRRIVESIKPLFQRRNGKNLIISGQPGVGKTVCLKHVLDELKQETDDIHCVYINCWKKDSAFKMLLQMCEDVEYAWVHNKSYDELIGKVIETINKKSAVIVLDEADKLTDLKLVYTLLDDLFRKTIIMITNNKEFLVNLDTRVKSRLMPEFLEFNPYNKSQVKDILNERIKYAFIPGVIEDKVVEAVAEKSFEAGDVRFGLKLLRSAGEEAENLASKKLKLEHLKLALEKLETLRTKEVSEEAEEVLGVIKENERTSILNLFEKYKEKGGEKSYRTFHRRLKELEEANLISIKEINKGFEDGRTNEVESVRKLDEF